MSDRPEPVVPQPQLDVEQVVGYWLAEADEVLGVADHLAAVSDAVMDTLRRFLAVVQERKRVEAAYLYGSQVTGSAQAWSDIDVAIVSPDFSSDLLEERLDLMRLAVLVDERTEPHPFTQQDFNVNNPLVGEIRRTGVRVV